MKKIISMILVLAMVLALAGCAGTTVVVNNYYNYDPNATEPAATETTEPVVAEGALKTGLAIVTTVSANTVSATDNAPEEVGAADFDVTLAAVVVDENDVIVDCAIDSIGTTINYDTTGAITSDITAEVLTKNELGDNYNMKTYGGAVAEWYEQAEALAQYCIGKTIHEIQDGAINEEGYAADADLATSATIYLGDYVNAIVTAYSNAQVLGAESGDELVLSCTTSQADTTQGNAQLNVDAVALTINDEGVITSCQLDAVQAKATIDENGEVTGLNADSKNTLGFDYGMVAYANAKYEWFEQAANFAAYITGKTAAEVEGIAIDEATKPADADLATSVTISIYGFKALIAKALG